MPRLESHPIGTAGDSFNGSMNLFRRRFGDLSIRTKVTLVTLASSLLALIAVAGGLYIFQLRTFRQTFEHELRTLARIMAENCASTLAFNDVKTTANVIAPLAVKRDILSAGVMRSDGREIAIFGAKNEYPPPKRTDPAGVIDRGSTWTIVEPIALGGKRIGTLFFDADYARPLRELQHVYLGVTALALIASLFLAGVLTRPLQRFITQPVHLLAQASEAVARDGDYSMRVIPQGDDELGQLTRAFNHMLARIDEQDAALRHQVGERTQAEAEVKRVHQQLVDASRMAGMAEVATGVLHNVGNVLNSVNIAASRVSEKLRWSKVEGLAKAVALLSEHKADLGHYFSHDPQGQRLAAYLEKVSGFLTEENAEMLQELDRLCRNVEHIKEVVAMQQNYARVSSIREDVDPTQLIEDAMQMNSATFTRHGINLVRDCQPVPTVHVEKHKALQILVNLIRNAKHALEDSTLPDRRLTVRLQAPEPARVRFVVEDTGVGIPPENLTRIFQHGFTTKKNGHGFGLHSCAIAAKELGGTLSAFSKGAGCGAVFTLELPAVPETRPS